MTEQLSDARELAAMIVDCEPDEMPAMVLPHCDALDRAASIDKHAAAVEELRAAGWGLKTRIGRALNGEVLAIELLHYPKAKDA